MMQTMTAKATPSSIGILSANIRSLVARYWWELLFLGLIMMVYHLAALRSGGFDELLVELLFIDGALGNSGSFIFLVLAAFWSFRVWTDLPPGKRSSFLVYPVDRLTHHITRIAAGALVLFAVFITAWILGALLCEIFGPGRSWFTNEAYTGVGWTKSLLGLLNSYLFGTILALNFRRPEIWYVVLLPVGLTALGIILELMKFHAFRRTFSSIFMFPSGLTASFGFVSDIRGGAESLPHYHVFFVWLLILSVGTVLSIMVRREE
jgi:hypothetical protein